MVTRSGGGGSGCLRRLAADGRSRTVGGGTCGGRAVIARAMKTSGVPVTPHVRRARRAVMDRVMGEKVSSKGGRV